MLKIAETIAQASYGKSADPNHPDNANEDFQAGYKVGINMPDFSEACAWEYAARGRPDPNNPEGFRAWKEWKRGFWAASFTAIDHKNNG